MITIALGIRTLAHATFAILPCDASFASYTLLDTITSEQPAKPETSKRALCTLCNNGTVQGETLCLDHWIAAQTKPVQPVATSKPKTTSKPALGMNLDSINLDSIVRQMESGNKWQN